MNSSSDGHELVGQLEAMLQDIPKSLSIDRVIDFSPVNETIVKWLVEFPCFLH